MAGKHPAAVHDAQIQSIPGYDYAQPGIARSPVSLEELSQIEETLGWSEQDAHVLQRHRPIIEGQADRIVDIWQAVIAAHPHLAQSFSGPGGEPDEEYKAKVRARIVQWIRDVCDRPHDQVWLDYQEEIGLRHTPAKKNQTDLAQSPPIVPLRYLLAFTAVVIGDTRAVFTNHGLSREDLGNLEEAWTKAVLLHVLLWARPYAKEGWW